MLVCTQKVYKLDAERLYATYFGGEEKQGLKPDEEARQIWLVLSIQSCTVLSRWERLAKICCLRHRAAWSTASLAIFLLGSLLERRDNCHFLLFLLLLSPLVTLAYTDKQQACVQLAGEGRHVIEDNLCVS